VTKPRTDRGHGSHRWRAPALALLVVLLDQLSKAWAWSALASGQVEPLLPGLLQLRRVANTGAAFSLFSGAPRLLGVVSALVSGVLLVWLLRQPPTGRWRIAGLGLLLGGAVGNGIDRWRLGWVMDFLEFVPIEFPVFNLADVAINLAVASLLIELLLGPRQRHG
jgi:signal peptidase II